MNSIEEELEKIQNEIFNRGNSIASFQSEIYSHKQAMKDLRKKAKQLEKLQKKAAELVGK